MDASALGNVFSVLALACSSLALALAYVKSPSHRAVAILRGCEEQAKAHLAAARQLESRWQSEVNLFSATRDSWSQEFSAIGERCEELLDRTESKRRRFAAAESRQNAATAVAEPVPQTREDILAATRARLRGVG